MPEEVKKPAAEGEVRNYPHTFRDYPEPHDFFLPMNVYSSVRCPLASSTNKIEDSLLFLPEAQTEALLRLPWDEEAARPVHHGEGRGELYGADRSAQEVHEGPRFQHLKSTFRMPPTTNNSQACQVNVSKDPCAQESKLSMKCLNDHDYDRIACQKFFDNYNNCKKFWLSVQRNRRSAGIYPLLPPPEDRDQIKKKYQETGEIPTTPEG